jgi:methanethiol S-methyltransferase
MQKKSNSTIIRRISMILLALPPVIFWRAFYEHFEVYLTGTILSQVITMKWHIALLSIVVFMLFLLPLSYRKKAKWVDYGLVGAFFISLFIEMYGIPLTILFASKYLFIPGVIFPDNVVEFELFGVGMGMDHAMLYGAVLMMIGMEIIVIGWWSLYRQAKKSGFARKGIYSISRNPQYVGFIMLILGWFFGWPTPLTAIFSPILIYKYIKAARAEEREMLASYGESYGKYSETAPFLL